MIEGLETEYTNAAVYLEQRIIGTLQAAKEVDGTESKIKDFLELFYDIRKYVYMLERSKFSDYGDADVDTRMPEDLRTVKKILKTKEPEDVFERKSLENLLTALAERFLIPRKLFDFWSVVKAMESPKFEMDKLECKLMLNDLKNFKKQLQELEAQIKESVLAQWYRQESELGEKSKYLLVNSATRVSDVLKRSDTISASVIDVGHPYWYQQESRGVLFVYRPTAEQVLGMFPSDSSTAEVENYSDISDALIQLLVSDGLQGKRRLVFNSSGFRPAYPLESLVSTKDNVSEVLLNGECEPVGIVLTNERDTKDALAFRQLAPSITLWKLVDGKLRLME